MKKKLIIVVVLVIIAALFVWNWWMFSPQNLNLPDDSRELNYRVYWMLVPVGRANISIEEEAIYGGRESILIKAEAKTEGFVKRLFNAQFEALSVLEKEKKIPLLYKETVFRAGRESASKELIYDQQNHYLKHDDETYIIKPETHDLLSIFLFFKGEDLVLDNAYSANVNCNKNNYEVAFKVIDEISFADRNLIVLQGASERKGGERARKRTEFKVYLDAETQIPTLIEVFTVLGPVKAKLL
jgi:hypothetical protein